MQSSTVHSRRFLLTVVLHSRQLSLVPISSGFSAQPSVQYQGRKGTQVFHVWMRYQGMVDLQLLLRVREDLQQCLSQVAVLEDLPCWHEKVLLYTGNSGQGCGVGC